MFILQRLNTLNEELWVIPHIIAPVSSLGSMMAPGTEKRGILDKTESKAITKGHGSFDFEFDKYEIESIIKFEININEEPVDVFLA